MVFILTSKFTNSNDFYCEHDIKRDGGIYLSVCCVRSLRETGRQGRASQSCSQHTAAYSPRRSSLTGWASLGTPEKASPAARSPYSIGRYLTVTALRKTLGLGSDKISVCSKLAVCHFSNILNTFGALHHIAPQHWHVLQRPITCNWNHTTLMA